MQIKIHQLILALLLSTLISCTNQQTPDRTGTEIAQATPQVLSEKDYMSKSVSFSRKGYTDIITQLYEEAGKKDKALQALHRHINSLGELRDDSLAAYQNYDRTNTQYFQDAKNLSAQITDSTLREETLKSLGLFEQNYRDSVSEYEKKHLNIDEKALALHDQLILLKLAITRSMIKNYQANEIPNIEALTKIIQEYDEVIQETEALINK